MALHDLNWLVVLRISVVVVLSLRRSDWLTRLATRRWLGVSQLADARLCVRAPQAAA